MTVAADLVRAVYAAQQKIPAHTPLLIVSDQIAQQLHEPPTVVMQILLGYHIQTQERAA